MQYRKFGRTDWRISEICFGAWQLGGTWGHVGKKEALKTLHCAFNHGINFIDTASAYGAGQSERLIGEALKSYRKLDMSEIYVTTKVTPIDANKHCDATSIVGRYPKTHLIEQVEASLKRLQVETIDLLQLHLWYEDGVQNLEWLDVLKSLVAEGKIRQIGVSLPDIKPESGIELAKSDLVVSQQVIYNLFEQTPRNELFRVGEKTNMAFIARVPFDSGALTGTWNKSTYDRWSHDDKRHHMYKGKSFAHTLDRVEKLKLLCAHFDLTLPEVAMRFCLADTAVSTVACGMRNVEEVEKNTVYSSDKGLPDELLTLLQDHNWKHNFY